MFSKSCEYGIKAVVYIAQQSLQKKRVKLNDIADKIDSPSAFTAKTLQLLSKKKLIKSVMGKEGGYEIDTSLLNQITILDIVNIIDGDEIHSRCALGLKECSEKLPCPIHHDYKKIKNDLKDTLCKSTIQDLASNLNNRLTHLKI